MTENERDYILGEAVGAYMTVVRSGQGHCRRHNKKWLRWIWEVTKVDRIRNERYGIEAPKVGEIAMEIAKDAELVRAWWEEKGTAWEE